MDTLKRMEEELARLGLYQTLETLKSEAKASGQRGGKSMTGTVFDAESTSSPTPSLSKVESSQSAVELTPLAIAQPVYSEPGPPLPHRHSADSATTKSPQRRRKATPQFIVVPVHDPSEFKMTELSNKAFSDKANYEE